MVRIISQDFTILSLLLLLPLLLLLRLLLQLAAAAAAAGKLMPSDIINLPAGGSSVAETHSPVSCNIKEISLSWDLVAYAGSL